MVPKQDVTGVVLDGLHCPSLEFAKVCYGYFNSLYSLMLYTDHVHWSILETEMVEDYSNTRLACCCCVQRSILLVEAAGEKVHVHTEYLSSESEWSLYRSAMARDIPGLHESGASW
jgi:hypothetical protein